MKLGNLADYGLGAFLPLDNLGLRVDIFSV